MIWSLIQKVIECFEKKFIGERDDGHFSIGMACTSQLNDHGKRDL
jgi:hypothetical protein